MKKISFDFCTNMPGMSLVYAIPPSSFKRIRHNYSDDQYYLELIHPENIIDFYFTEDTAQFKQTGENNGYKTELLLIAPKDQQRNRKTFVELMAGYWYLLFLDNNNNIRFVGTKENQLRFAMEATTSGRNQVACSFYGFQDEPAVFLEDFGINII